MAVIIKEKPDTRLNLTVARSFHEMVKEKAKARNLTMTDYIYELVVTDNRPPRCSKLSTLQTPETSQS
ncbi:hypothetical protein V6R21_20415 [Limibacter armeniacum]|uniref:hypothetical protein n=1 Tax=Limibacter armeniacum TaxID=466084 RepID=UPI002FE6C423